MLDKCGQDSHYIKDGKAYFLKNDEPYEHQFALGSVSAIGMFSIPFIYGDDGYLIKISEFDDLPKIDLDAIILSVERTPGFDFSTIRKAYPNAAIIATLKENNPTYSAFDRAGNPLPHKNYCQETLDNFKQADAGTVPFSKIERFEDFRKLTGKKQFYRLPQPYDIDYIYNNYFKQQRREKILAYQSWSHIERGQKKAAYLAHQLSQQYGIPGVTGKPNQTFDWYLQLTAHVTFTFNLEPLYCVGNQGVQSAILGTIQFGGIADSNMNLFPELATNDTELLKEKFHEIYTNFDRRVEVMQYAHNKARELYSFEYFRKQLDYILSEV